MALLLNTLPWYDRLGIMLVRAGRADQLHRVRGDDEERGPGPAIHQPQEAARRRPVTVRGARGVAAGNRFARLKWWAARRSNRTHAFSIWHVGRSQLCEKCQVGADRICSHVYATRVYNTTVHIVYMSCCHTLLVHCFRNGFYKAVYSLENNMSMPLSV